MEELGTDFVSFNFGDTTAVTLDLANSEIKIQEKVSSNYQCGECWRWKWDDKLFGNSSDNVLKGGLGNDTLVGTRK